MERQNASQLQKPTSHHTKIDESHYAFKHGPVKVGLHSHSLSEPLNIGGIAQQERIGANMGFFARQRSGGFNGGFIALQDGYGANAGFIAAKDGDGGNIGAAAIHIGAGTNIGLATVKKGDGGNYGLLGAYQEGSGFNASPVAAKQQGDGAVLGGLYAHQEGEGIALSVINSRRKGRGFASGLVATVEDALGRRTHRPLFNLLLDDYNARFIGRARQAANEVADMSPQETLDASNEKYSLLGRLGMKSVGDLRIDYANKKIQQQKEHNYNG